MQLFPSHRVLSAGTFCFVALLSSNSWLSFHIPKWLLQVQPLCLHSIKKQRTGACLFSLKDCLRSCTDHFCHVSLARIYSHGQEASCKGRIAPSSGNYGAQLKFKEFREIQGNPVVRTLHYGALGSTDPKPRSASPYPIQGICILKEEGRMDIKGHGLCSLCIFNRQSRAYEEPS